MVRQKPIRSWLGSLISDRPFALRQTRKSPGIAMAAVQTLAVGIGSTTAIFSASRRTGDVPQPPER